MVQHRDVAAITPEGFLQITDRTRSVIKSGGEWIGSIEIENAAVNHPDIAEAAVIGRFHPKWTKDLGDYVSQQERHCRRVMS